MRRKYLTAIPAVAAVFALFAPHAQAADITNPGNPGGGVSGGGEVSAWVGAGGSIQVSGGGGSTCVYWLVDASGSAAPTGVFPTHIDENGSQFVWVAWDCDGDGQRDGYQSVELVTPEVVAFAAWDEARKQLPDFGLQFSMTTPLAGFPMTLSLENGAWQPVSATASVSGLTATTTATPVRVEWDLGPVSELVGRNDLRHVTCDGPGVFEHEQSKAEKAPCVGWWATTSADVTDELGNYDRATVTATVVWEVTFVTSTGVVNNNWFTHNQVLKRHDVPVAEAQVVSSS